jgi:hypothetical protein
MIVVMKDEKGIVRVPSNLTLSFYRAFRDELWQQGIWRDPVVGDKVLGVEILALTI